jgi:GT2 family glycosyltransferase
VSAPGDGHDLPVIAAVVTHRRPRLAGDVVRRLINDEGLPPASVILVVNGDGGLDDPDLEARVHTIRLAENTGPAGGFAEALRQVSSRLGTARWVYVCEDDVDLFDVPVGRLASLVAEVEGIDRAGQMPIGAVLAYGRDLNPRTGITLPHRPSTPSGFDGVDVGCWGATLVSRAVLEAGVLPDAELFFGFEDFDFWLKVTEAGFAVLLDNRAAVRVALSSRGVAFAGERPLDDDEAWRRYYAARNFLELARRHGHLGWTVTHLVKSLRRMQLARSAAERRAILAGLWDGFRRRLGSNPRYQRQASEL